MSKFGWSLPAGVSSLPGEDEPDIPVYRCETCGAFLAAEPVSTIYWETKAPCDGQAISCGGLFLDTPCGMTKAHEPHTYVLDSGVTETRRCRKCGQENYLAK